MALNQLTPDERRCVEAYLAELGSRTRTQWRVGPKLDKKFPNLRTPECILTSDASRVAIEVKRLFDDESPAVFGAADALARGLKPRVDGHIVLCLPRAYRGRRMPRLVVANLQGEIERVAPTLRPGKMGFVRVHHRSRLERIGDGQGFVGCQHRDHHGVQRLRAKVPGLFWLRDGDAAGEAYTPEAAADLEQTLLGACRDLEASDKNDTFVDWYEEWEMRRVKGSGVFVMTFAGGWSGPEAVVQRLERVLQDGNGKFEDRVWAPTNVLLIHDLFLGGANEGDVKSAFEARDPVLYRNLHEIWLYSDGKLSALYNTCGVTTPPAPSPPATS